MWGVKWGALETQLVHSVGFPRVLIPLPPATRVVWATSQEEIDEELRGVSDAEDLRKRLHSDLAAKQAKWDTAAEALGLNIADWQEESIRRRSEEIADAIFALPARGLPGVIAKLELILRMGETRQDDEETPWGELRSTVADLRRLAVPDDARQTEASMQSIG
jgi:hypothetical protein